ncbi:MAG TPA: hypothetical protein VFE60_23035 [Roseiarcus sp.]|jgi:hypothetical protein|nr:hypothetical protein [Roseiarcus sp.]
MEPRYLARALVDPIILDMRGQRRDESAARTQFARPWREERLPVFAAWRSNAARTVPVLLAMKKWPGIMVGARLSQTAA